MYLFSEMISQTGWNWQHILALKCYVEVTRNALANDEDEPKMPDELKAFPALQAKKPKIHFDQDASPSSQAISPMPVPETSGAETPPKLNLNTKRNGVSFGAFQEYVISAEFIVNTPKN